MNTMPSKELFLLIAFCGAVTIVRSQPLRPGGTWRFFPPFKSFQEHTPRYDAFPSGHLATVISTVTVFADNYPEKHWIKTDRKFRKRPASGIDDQ